MRVISYNIHKGIGGRDRRYRLERIIRVIEEQHPDIICLQEVDRHVARTRHDDQPRKLADAFVRWSISISSTCGVKDGGYGNLVLSRWPFRVASPGLAPAQEAQAPRCAAGGRRDARGPACNWCTGTSAWPSASGTGRSRHLLEHALFRESAHLPTLIVGDFNDWRNTLARGPFARHGFVQVTAPRWRFRSFPAYLPVASLDKAFVRGPSTIRHARIVHSRLARDASDHLPLVVDFHLDHRGTR